MTGQSLDDLLTLPREPRIARLAALVPESLRHGSLEAVHSSPIRGGRQAALAGLSVIDPVAYARSRNHVGGAVSKLSPWIRHGVLSLAEVRDAALARVPEPAAAEKFISELAWRDYWRQVHAAVGVGIFASIEAPAARPRRERLLDRVPDDVLEARTGMACIDAFVRRLHDTGWLHNHERMWLASWLVHVRGVRWQAGAEWFLTHLLDGDPASNHLSWQWVAGTFAAKPYLFNRENLERFTAGAHCRDCPVRGHCDVEGSYDDLAARLFVAVDPARPPLRIPPAPAWQPGPAAAPGAPLVWLTLDSLAVTSPALRAHPDAPRLFVLDPHWLARERPALKRLAFIFECLAEIDRIEVVIGPPEEVVPVVARRRGCGHVAVAATPCPFVRAAAAAMATAVPVRAVEEPPLCDRARVRDLGRFSRYWSQVSRSALRPTPAG